MQFRSMLILHLSTIALMLYGCGGFDAAHRSEAQVSKLQGANSIGGSTCEQQAAWGKCGESWMHPTCDAACGSQGHSIGGASCEQQAAWGKCGESWMHPTCDSACPATGYYYYDPNVPGRLVYVDLGAHNGPNDHGRNGGRVYTNGGLLYPDLGARNGGCGGGGGGYTNGGLIYPDLGAHNGGSYGGGGGGYTNGGLIYPDLGAHNGGRRC